MKDPYEILGVARDATEAQIRSAYRKLAKQHHPDLHPGKPEAEARFKEIAAANDILSDPEKRARFDRGEIDASGAERPPERNFYRDFGDDAGRSKYRSAGGFDADDLESILAQAFGAGAGRGFDARGPDARFSLSVDFLTAANGAVRRVTMPDGRTLDVKIPAGVADEQVLRLKGQGMPGFGKGPPGDALVEVRVMPHPIFKRDGKDVLVELPVTLKEAVLGAKVQVPTVSGPVTMTIPPNSTSGTKLRLKGRGIAGGDQYATIKIVLPSGEEPELKAFLESWSPSAPFNPRKDMVSP